MGKLLVAFQSVRRWQRDPDSTHPSIQLPRSDLMRRPGAPKCARAGSISRLPRRLALEARRFEMHTHRTVVKHRRVDCSTRRY